MWTALRNGRPPLRPWPVGHVFRPSTTNPTGAAAVGRLRPSGVRVPSIRRHATRAKNLASLLRANTPLAQQLAQEEPWDMKQKCSKLGDASRINIVSEGLVDDVLKYVGDDLVERHRGCDIVDLNPGTGLWSAKLHELLEPRTHILMEPDKVYQPYLEPLARKKGVQLLPESGLVWSKLLPTLREKLQHQKPQHLHQEGGRARNDTLLVTVNLGFYPPKKWGSQSSLGVLVLYQLLHAISTAHLFQMYGLVRMLVWVRDDEKTPAIAQSMQTRRRTAVESEMYTDWVRVVTSADPDVQLTWHKRGTDVDVISAANVAERMRRAGIEFPRHRRSLLQKMIDEEGPEELLEKMANGQLLAHAGKAWVAELEQLEALDLKKPLKKDSEKFERLRKLRARRNLEIRAYDKWQQAEAKIQVVEKAYARGDPDAETQEEELEMWLEEMFTSQKLTEMERHRENLRSVTVPAASIPWDRRPYEPLIDTADEFFPNYPLALLDIQPKNPHPSLLPRGQDSNRAGEYFEILLAGLFGRSKSIGTSLRSMWFGAAEAIAQGAPSLQDPAYGGTQLKKICQIPARAMTEKMLLEILDAFMSWPFRPDYAEFLAKTSPFDLTEEQLAEVAAITKSKGDNIVDATPLAEPENAIEASAKAAAAAAAAARDIDVDMARRREETVKKLRAKAAQATERGEDIETILSRQRHVAHSSPKKPQVDMVTQVLRERKEEAENQIIEKKKAAIKAKPRFKRNIAEMKESREQEAKLVAAGMSASEAKRHVREFMADRARERHESEHNAELKKAKRTVRSVGIAAADIVCRERRPEKKEEVVRRLEEHIAQGMDIKKAKRTVKEELARERSLSGESKSRGPKQLRGHLHGRFVALRDDVVAGGFITERTAHGLARSAALGEDVTADEVRQVLQVHARRTGVEAEARERRIAELAKQRGISRSRALKFEMQEYKLRQQEALDQNVKAILGRVARHRQLWAEDDKKRQLTKVEGEVEAPVKVAELDAAELREETPVAPAKPLVMPDQARIRLRSQRKAIPENSNISTGPFMVNMIADIGDYPTNASASLRASGEEAPGEGGADKHANSGEERASDFGV